MPYKFNPFTGALDEVNGNNATNINFTQSGTGAVTRTVDSKLRDVVSVKDFGAVGDGVTNDAAAIQAAVNACAGKTIYFPPGTYIVASRITFISNTHLKGESGQSILKLATQNWPAQTGILFNASLLVDIELESLRIDGNKGNIGTNRSPLVVFFRSQNIKLRNCIFENVEGISVLLSTDIDDIKIQDCQFLNCGGNPNNSDGYRKQGIAFTNDAPYRCKNAVIEGCYFYLQGLDCISLEDIDNVAVLNNVSVDSYTLVYNNPNPHFVTNLVVQGNVVANCSEFGAGTPQPPVPFDLPDVKGLVLVGNSVYGCDTAAIGVFSGARDALVAGNTIVNAMQDSNIRFCAIAVHTAENVTVSNNVIRDTNTPSKTQFGIVVKTDAVNVLVSNNTIQNVSTSRFGYFVNNPFAGEVFAFTTPSQLSSTTQVIDTDASTRLTREYSRRHILVEDNTNAALTVTQTGTGYCFVVEDAASTDATPFIIDNDGKVGVRLSPATFGAALTAASSGSIPPLHLLGWGNDANGAGIRFNKTRATSPYSQGLVVDGDVLAALTARGSDGADFRTFASIEYRVDGAAAANSCPGRLGFLTTPSGSTTAVERLRIKPSGQVRFIPQDTPASAQAGDVYYDQTTNKLRCHNGSTWNDLF
jgi:hypothetical protein